MCRNMTIFMTPNNIQPSTAIDDYSTLPSITHEMYLSIALKIITSTPTQNDHTCTQRDHPSGVLNQYHQHYHRGCPPAQTTTTTPYIICSGPPYYIQHTTSHNQHHINRLRHVRTAARHHHDSKPIIHATSAPPHTYKQTHVLTSHTYR